MADAKTTALTNYTNPDAANDVLPIVDVANQQTKKITRNNLLGITSTPVGINDSQTLTNKTLTAPTINSPVLGGTITGTYTLAGTPTFPSAVVTLTGSQTLTNKVLTSPTINSPTITNASVTQDTVTGFTSANNGTVYGVSVTAGVITSAAVGSSSLVTGIQVANKTQNPYKFNVYRNAAESVATGTFAKVLFDTKEFDTGSNFDVITNNRFTAPITGFYLFSFLVGIGISDTDDVAAMYKNGTVYKWGNEAKGGGSGGTFLVSAAAGDFFEIYASTSVAALNVGSAPQKTWFSGFLVSAT